MKRAEESPHIPVHKFDKKVERTLLEIEERLSGNSIPEEQKRFFAIKLFERDEKILENMKMIPSVEDLISSLEKELDDDSESIITNERYQYISSIMENCCKKAGKGNCSTSDKIDRIVTNRWLGLPVFAAVMVLVYYVSITTVGGWATDWVNDNLFGDGWSLFGLVDVPSIPALITQGLEAVGCAPWLQGSDRGRNCSRSGSGSGICATDAGIVFLSGVSGGVRIWRVSLSSWIGFSENSVCQENPLFLC